MKKSRILALAFFIAISAMGLSLITGNAEAATSTINFSTGKMLAPNCFCASDVKTYGLAPWCGDRGPRWCNRESSTESIIVSPGEYKVKVNVSDLTDSQKYESAILTMNGKNYTIPDLGGNASSTGTGTYDLGRIFLSGNVVVKAKHKYATVVTGKWYPDPMNKIAGNPESINLSSVVLDPVPVPRPTCSMSANPTSINQGGSSALSWSSTNATSASINQGIGSVAVDGSRTVSPSTTTTYTGTFTGAGGTVTCSATVTVIPRPAAPTCRMNATPDNINQGGSSVLSWSSTNATSASINQGIGPVRLNNSRSVSPSTTTTYIGTFTGAGGTVTCSATVTVIPRPDAPVCRMNATPSNISQGESSTLSWSSTNATSASINQGIGTVRVDGSRSVSPRTTTTYTGTFTGPGGTVTCSATVTVNIPREPDDPTCSMNANPRNISRGGSSTLSWSSTNATSASINQGIGTVRVDGSRSVSPITTTTYTGTFTGPGGTVTCRATVSVGTPTPEPEPEPESDKECKGSIGNYIWNDANGDGVQDKNEEGLDNIRVKLIKISSNKIYRTETDSDGDYEFKNLCSGKYRVVVKDEDVSGFRQTYDPDGVKDNKDEVKLEGDNDSHTKADFGYQKGRSIPATGSGSLAIYLSALLSAAILVFFLKIRNKRFSLRK